MSNFLTGRTSSSLAGDHVVDVFTGGVDYTAGTSTTVTLTNDPGSENNVAIAFDGLVQFHDTYSISGTTVTFDAAIPTGTLKVEAKYGQTYAVGTVPDTSVDSTKLADDAVTTDKVAAGVVGPQSVQVFTSSGTWTKPAGINTVVVYVVGGGGSGAGASNASAATSGGAGGGCSIKLIDVSAISSETVTVGTGGAAPSAGANNGNNGNTSSFGSHCSATGGFGGLNSGDGRDGGSGSNGDLNFDGGASGPGGGWSSNIHTGSAGGGSFFGGGGKGNRSHAAGAAGNNYGGGGSGGASNTTTGNVAGGAGADGVVVVWEYI